MEDDEEMIFGLGKDFGYKLRQHLDHEIHKEMDRRGLKDEEREIFSEGVWDAL